MTCGVGPRVGASVGFDVPCAPRAMPTETETIATNKTHPTKIQNITDLQANRPKHNFITMPL
jgi:hypothetical protein